MTNLRVRISGQNFRSGYARGHHSFGDRANPLQIHVETPRPWPVSSAPQPASTKKWACAHSSVRPLQSEFRVYSHSTAKARHQPAVGDRSFCFELSDEPINVAKYPHFAIRPSLNLNTAAPAYWIDHPVGAIPKSSPRCQSLRPVTESPEAPSRCQVFPLQVRQCDVLAFTTL